MFALSMRYATDNTGKRSAVRNNSGKPVYPSGPGLGVGPTPPPTAGRKPEACPYPPQPKTGWELEGKALGGREAPALNSLDAVSLSQLRQFFELLDRWDREAHEQPSM